MSAAPSAPTRVAVSPASPPADDARTRRRLAARIRSGLVQDQWLCFTYIGAVVLLVACRPVWTARLAGFGQAGRMALSRAWLARYRFGPLEWLWRVLTYARLQPLRRVVAPVARCT